MQGWASQVPQPAPPSQGGNQETTDPALGPSKELMKEPHTCSGVRSLDTDQESSFTSRTLGRLNAGLAPDLIPSGALGGREREGET